MVGLAIRDLFSANLTEDKHKILQRTAIEYVFSRMGLCYNKSHEFWHFPPDIDSEAQFFVREFVNGGHPEKPKVAIRVIMLGSEMWYSPDDGIKVIQELIYEIFETYVETRD